MQMASKQMWGRAPFGSDIPTVQAYKGQVPEGARGVEFTTNVPPDPYGLPAEDRWSGTRPDVPVEGDFAKICVVTIWTNQC